MTRPPTLPKEVTAVNDNYPLRFAYDFLPSLMLRDREFGHKIDLMKSVGVSTVWLDCYLTGEWDASLEDIAKCRRILMDEGFEVQALNVPLGHGSQALDPSQPLAFQTGDGWSNRVDCCGNPWPSTTCVDDKCIADSRKVLESLREIGFTRVFYDDDLRMGVWGPHMQGCFCDRCMKRFGDRHPQYAGLSRLEIVEKSRSDPALADAWMTMQCDSVLRFLDETTPEGMTPNFMIMHNGDRRHGLDITRMKQHFPDAYFRIGEGHFGDGSFLHPLGRDGITHSIKKQMRLVGDVSKTWSETTTYPVGDLSPENFVGKMRIEIGCGLRNIFLMSGTVFLFDEYWHAVRDALPELSELAASTPLPDLTVPYEDDFVWHL